MKRTVDLNKLATLLDINIEELKQQTKREDNERGETDENIEED